MLLQKERTSFVANQLVFAHLREAIHLVNESAASVEDIDIIVQKSMGRRWAAVGPFKSYHAGGGENPAEVGVRGVGGFFWIDVGDG